MAESKSRQSNEFAQDFHKAVIAQLGERQTEDLKVPGSIPGRGIFFFPISLPTGYSVSKALILASINPKLDMKK